jgi:hypothetical protein
MIKKFLFMAFVLAAFATSAWAQCKNSAGEALYCDWGEDGTECWAVNPEGTADCAARVVDCEGPAGDLKAGSYLFTGVSANGVCDGTLFVCDGCTLIDPEGGPEYCNYGPCVPNPSNQYGCTSGGCYVHSETDGCPASNIVTSCPVCNMPPANRPAGTNCDGDETPIIVSGRSVGLTVVPNGNALHVISEKGATVELFSLAGAKVFSSKVAAGNSVLSLEKQRQGVYYAVITSGSQKQTVKVVLK